MYTKRMKPQLVVDWINGYETPEEIRGVQVAFSTPHNLIQVPRSTELFNMQISYLTQTKNFSSLDEINAFLEPFIMNSSKLQQALEESDISDDELDYLDYLFLLDQAHQADLKEAKRLIFKSLLYYQKPVDAYLWIANHICKTRVDTDRILSYAVSLAESTLSKEMKKDMGNFWNTQKTRAYIRAKASYGEYFFFNATSSDQTTCGLSMLESVLDYDKQDHMGVRFLLMSIFSEESRFDKMADLFRRYPQDSQNPLFLYPMAFMYYTTLGPDHGTSTSFIHQAIRRNPHVMQIILNDDIIPFFEGPSFTKQSPEEAAYFLNINFDYIEPDETFIEWLQRSYEEYLTKIPSDQEGIA